MATDLNTSATGDEEASSSSNNTGRNHDFGTAQALEVGNKFETLDDVFGLYCEYSRLMGFGVKKGSQTYFKGTVDVRMKVFLCTWEGRPDEKASLVKEPFFRKQQMRSQCKARLRVCRDSMEIPWTVTVFNTQHNHELLPQSQGYLVRSARKLTVGKAGLVAALHASGIGVSRAHMFMSNEAGGRQNIGFLRKDAYHYLDRLHKEQRQPDGDANALVKFFLDRANKETNFYSNVDTDEDGRIVNFFFRDSRCKIDYYHFGDVLFVDTTYKTNKYNLYCVPFTGINHHRNNVMFGIGFLSNETTESFEWLFGKFLESMDGKEPQVIFTDQCQAMMNGVDYTFHEARHRLCQWHINKNTKNHFGKLKGNEQFNKEWMYCMKECETEKEFEDRWRAMINDYKPTTSRDWFKNMYKLRNRWASVFTQDKFSAGSQSTSRSESTNRALKDLCSASTPLFELVLKYELMLKGWRDDEAAEDAANRGIPGGLCSKHRLLRHISEIYTRSVFRLFETEAVDSLDVDITKFPLDFKAPTLEYSMTSHGGSERIRTVKFNRYTHEATCSCHMWETEGVVCRHIFKIYTFSMVAVIPDALVLRRWTKGIKSRISNDHFSFDVTLGRPDFVRLLGFGNRIMRLCYDLIDECKSHGYEDIIEDGFNEMKAKVCARMKRDVPEQSANDSKKTTRDPIGKKPRGGSKRFRSNLDSSKAKRAPKPTCTQTPNSKKPSSMSPSVSNCGSQSHYDDEASQSGMKCSIPDSSRLGFG